MIKDKNRYPSGNPVPDQITPEGSSRRSFLKGIGVVLTLAFTGCSSRPQPDPERPQQALDTPTDTAPSKERQIPSAPLAVYTTDGDINNPNLRGALYNPETSYKTLEQTGWLFNLDTTSTPPGELDTPVTAAVGGVDYPGEWSLIESIFAKTDSVVLTDKKIIYPVLDGEQTHGCAGLDFQRGENCGISGLIRYLGEHIGELPRAIFFPPLAANESDPLKLAAANNFFTLEDLPQEDPENKTLQFVVNAVRSALDNKGGFLSALEDVAQEAGLEIVFVEVSGDGNSVTLDKAPTVERFDMGQLIQCIAHYKLVADTNITNTWVLSNITVQYSVPV